MKKRKDGRYAARRTIAGKKVDFYGSSPAAVYRKIEEYEELAGRPPTFDTLVTRWEDDKWDEFAPGTRNCYRSAVERARQEIGKTTAKDVTPADVQIILDRMAAQGYSAKAVKTQKSVISTIYRHALIKGIYKGNNPAAVCTVKRGLPRTQREPPDEDTLARIRADAWLYPKLLLYTGLRRGEALALRYEDIDRHKKTLRVEKQIIYESDRPLLVNRTKTEAGTRTVPIPDVLLAEIPDNKTGPMFETTLRRFKTDWDRFCERIGRHVTPHQLRHAYATMLHDANIDVKDAQILLGHSDVRLTQNIYTHIDNSRRTASAEKLNDYLASLLSPDNTPDPSPDPAPAAAAGTASAERLHVPAFTVIATRKQAHG